MGIHLDEPSSPVLPATNTISPVYKQTSSSPVISPVSRSPEADIVNMRHGVTVTKIPKHRTGSANISKVCKSDIDAGRSSMEEQTEQDMSLVVQHTRCLSIDETCFSPDRPDKTKITKCNKNDKTGGSISKQGVMVNLSGDVGDSSPGLLKEEENVSVLDKAGYSERMPVNTEELSDEGSSDNVEFTLSSETDSTVTEQARRTEKKKRKLHNLLPALKRSQSVGCETKLVVNDAGHLVECPPDQVCQEKLCDPIDTSRRVIHKTCSADATMMASDVLPIDPQEFMKNKQKSSIARNMRKKLQKLKRRNTDSLLGAAIMTVRGATKITQSDAVQWAASFDSLLADKNGLEMFRNFLKSEFSEENIEFWVACEEFKTVRTNKLVSRAQKIYSDFIATNAPKQVNLDSKTRLETVTNLENPTRDLFKQAQKRIQFLMENDSYKRFLDSDTYKHVIQRYSSSEGR